MEKLYTAQVEVRSGRDGSVRSNDGLLDSRLAFPKALGGDGNGTNPEQLFAAGYAACFGSTLGLVAKAEKHVLTDVSIVSEVDMLHEAGTYDLAVRLTVRAKGADRATLLALIEKTKQACPYSRSTRSSISTTITVAEGIA
jgi:osmotically inducible protein OsmC